MERVIDEFLSTDIPYMKPYINHSSKGCMIGMGYDIGGGSAKVSYRPKENYTGKSLKNFNGKKLYYINGYVLYVTHIHFPYAMGEIIKNDFSTQKCYIIRVNNHIAVAESLHSAIKELRSKIKVSTDNEYDVAHAFVLGHPDYEKEYDWDEMVFWHSLTHYSCREGRQRFSNMAKKPKGSRATPKELIRFMKQSKDRTLAEKIEKIYLSKNDKK